MYLEYHLNIKRCIFPYSKRFKYVRALLLFRNTQGDPMLKMKKLSERSLKVASLLALDVETEPNPQKRSLQITVLLEFDFVSGKSMLASFRHPSSGSF